MRVLVACEFSGIVRDAFAARGHDAWSCDLLPSESPGNHIQGDVLDILDEGWDMMIAHPPCTYLTCTGNKWFKPEYAMRFPDRHKQREEGVAFFMCFANANIGKICIENPVGIISTRWRKPDQIIQPFRFGHIEAKATCLWLKNLPLLSPAYPLFEPDKIKTPEYVTFKSGKRMAKWYVDAAKSTNRAGVRSRTFQGIADAMAIQWSGASD